MTSTLLGQTVQHLYHVPHSHGLGGGLGNHTIVMTTILTSHLTGQTVQSLSLIPSKHGLGGGLENHTVVITTTLTSHLLGQTVQGLGHVPHSHGLGSGGCLGNHSVVHGGVLIFGVIGASLLLTAQAQFVLNAGSRRR